MFTIRVASAFLYIMALLALCGANSAQETAPRQATKELSATTSVDDLVGEQPSPRTAGKTASPEQKKLTDNPGQKSEVALPPRPGPMQVGLDILVNGKPLRTIDHKGKSHLPVPKVGAEYEIRVWNHGPHRIAAIVSVDGLSVIDGQPASESRPGYIVSPYSSIRIKGWRRSLDTVAAFAFVDREKSYANLTGQPENIGIIGLIAIEEHVWTPRPLLEKQDSAKGAARTVGSIGTDYGRDVDSRVYYVPFVRSNNRRLVTIYYDTVAALRKAGVPVDPPMPVPFPADPEFAPPPPGYKTK
jgi:hypothetical protein